ncbi:MAG TPA: hypothetical protein HA354_06050 [Candidatus Poseidoniaceae archaeon]|nr:hypothetical protein [Candidatus Poseidoniaceae archaeon]
MAPPKGLIGFSELELCQPYKRQLQVVIGLSTLIGVVGILAVVLGELNFMLIPLIFAVSTAIAYFFGPDIMSVVKTPLAVNMNHPFFAEEPLGKATVHVRFSKQNWLELGPHRVRLVKDEMIGGFNLVEDHDDYRLIGHFTASNNKTRIMKQVIIINQALSLRDGVNQDYDPIEGARERETMDYGLLERDWLDDEEISVEGPLAKLISKE